MNQENPKTPREELEARLTALLLGELPADEAAALRLAIKQDAELARLYDRLKDTIKLVREAVATPAEQTVAQTASLKLSDERRQKLLAHFKTVTPKEFVHPRRRETPWMVPMSIAAILMALIGVVVLLPEFSRRNPYGVTPLPMQESRLQVDLLQTSPSRGSDRVRAEATAELAAEVSTAKPVPQVYFDNYSYNKKLAPQSVLKPAPENARHEVFGLAPPPVLPPAVDRKEIILPKDGESTDAVGRSATEVTKVERADAISDMGTYFGGVGAIGGGGGGGIRNGYPGVSGTGTLTPGAPAAAGASGGDGQSAAVAEPEPVGVLERAATQRIGLRPIEQQTRQKAEIVNSANGVVTLNVTQLGEPKVVDGNPVPTTTQRSLMMKSVDSEEAQRVRAELRRRDTSAKSGFVDFDVEEVQKQGARSDDSKGTYQGRGKLTFDQATGRSYIVTDKNVYESLPEPAGNPQSIGDLVRPGTYISANEYTTPPVSVTRRLELQRQPQSATNGFLERYGMSRPQSELPLAGPAPASVPIIDPTTGLPVAADWFLGNGRGDLAAGQPQSNWRFSEARSNWDEKSTSRLGDVEQESRPSVSVREGFLFDNRPVGEPKHGVQLAGIPTTTTSNPELESRNGWVEKNRLGWKNSDGTFDEDGDKVPILGDVPAADKFFRSELKSAEAEGKTLSKLELPTTPTAAPRSVAVSGVVITNGTLGTLPLERDYAKNDKIHDEERILPEGTVRKVKLPGSIDLSLLPVNPAVVAGGETLSRRSSSFGLTPVQTETGVQEYENSGKVDSLFAAANDHADTSSLVGKGLEKQPAQVSRRLGWMTPSNRNASDMPETEILRRNQSLRVEAEKQPIVKETQRRQAKTMSLEELKEVPPNTVAEPTLAEVTSQPNQVAQNLAELGKNSAPATPEGVRAKAQVDESKKKTDDRIAVAGPKNGAEPRKVQLESAETNRPYFAKKRELDQSVHFRDILAQKIAAESTDVSIPKSSMVEIVDLAQAQVAQNPTVWQRIGRALGAEAESVARIRVESDVSDINAIGDRPRAYDPYLVRTESEVIQSKAVLDKVIEKLKLNDAWAQKHGAGKKLKTEETLQLLKKKLDLRSAPNTGLMEIRVKSDKPEEAARIANTIAEVYRDYRLEQRKQLAVGGIETLKKTLVDEEEKIGRAKAELERLEQASAAPQPAQVKEEDRSIRRASTNAPIPQPEVQTCDSAFSTFSLNVSDVSFKLAAASLEKGQMPDAASVRTEEFINAFDYRDPEPTAGVPVAFAWERARHPFAHNRDLLRFSIKTAAAGRQAGRPLNLVLLLDNSGSMERADRVRIIREALRVLAAQLQPQDKISVITFARTPRLWVDGVAGDMAGEIAEQVSGLTPQGGTNLEDAMNLAYQTAARHYLANGMNRVVVLTDGAANLGNVEPDALKQKVETQRKQGIALDCFGIGWEGFNDDLLEVLSRNGDGRYGFINSPEEAATEFAGQLAGALKVAASDVKVQVEFNPKRVTAYRQIGYAKHQLTKEQFRDNTVDAAEIAAQEAGNALYTVEVNPQGEGPLCIVRVRFKIPGTSDYREREWAVPFTANAVSLEPGSPAMRLAASASAFSEWLVASPFAGEVTPDRLLGYLAGVPEIYGADARPKKLEWMIRQAKSIAGQ